MVARALQGEQRSCREALDRKRERDQLRRVEAQQPPSKGSDEVGALERLCARPAVHSGRAARVRASKPSLAGAGIACLPLRTQARH